MRFVFIVRVEARFLFCNISKQKKKFNVRAGPNYFFQPKATPDYFFKKSSRPPPDNEMVAPLDHVPNDHVKSVNDMTVITISRCINHQCCVNVTNKVCMGFVYSARRNSRGANRSVIHTCIHVT